MDRPTITSRDVRDAELDLILGRTGVPHDARELWGLALSGGGIRSATFALGVLQTLARDNLLGSFHYLSTISGGGYIGAFLQGLIRRRGFIGACDVLRSSVQDVAEAADPAPGTPAVDTNRPILNLREYSNYLSPRKSAVSGDSLGMFGTYLRNVLLVQTQLFALLLGLAMIPLLLYPPMLHGAITAPWGLVALGGLTGAVAALAIGWILARADPRRARREASPERETGTRGAVDRRDVAPASVARVAQLSIALLFLAAWFGTAGLWGLNTRLGMAVSASGSATAEALSRAFDVTLGVAVAAVYGTCWMIWLAVALVSAYRRARSGTAIASPLRLHVVRFVVATFAASAIAGLAIVAVRHLIHPWLGADGLWHALAFGPTLVLTAVTLTGIFHIGFAGPALSDLQREVWARIGGRAIAFIALVAGGASLITIYGPFAVRYVVWYAQDSALLTTTGLLSVATWVLTTGAGVLAGYSQRVDGGRGQRSKLLDVAARVGPWVFLLGLAIGISFVAKILLTAFGWPPIDGAFEAGGKLVFSPQYFFASLAAGALNEYGVLVAVTAAALFVWLAFGYAIDLNEFSMNAFYRNRIVRCYLGASNAARTPEPTTNFDPNDDLVLADVAEVERIDGERPLFPLVGATLNLVATKQLDWQDRKAASFCFTPGFCGYLPPPSHPGAVPVGDATPGAAATARFPHDEEPIRFSPVAASMTLGDVVAISGAAVSPNMGYHSSPAVTLLLTLFDARLGWWLPNPSRAKSGAAASTRFSGGWLIAEMLGLTDETGRLLYLSDGGHFENLGIYELVRRRCRFILAVDSSADPNRDFADLGDAIQKCRTDFGVDVEIDTSDLRLGADGLSRRACAVGTIRYPDGDSGVLLYLKPSLTGAEPADVAHYARAHPSFPHEPTSDQYFDEAQFESYRRLGESVASRALDGALERAEALPSAVTYGQLGLAESALKQRILAELRHAWVGSLPMREHFSRHAQSVAQLFAKLRDTPALEVLDAQMYPSWIDLVESTPPAEPPDQRRTRLPAPEYFRTCFYFCMEMIQLMESVYHDMALEESFEHPDNRGWMNVFRHWSWAPIFRIAWAVGSPTFGRRFVTFCELRLELPRLHDLVAVRDASAHGVEWTLHCDRLAAEGAINHVERGILRSDGLLGNADPARFRLLLLRMKWALVLKNAVGEAKETTVGIAVIDGTNLRVLRVQDHLRRMGLGAEFMRLLTAQREVRGVDIRPGHYGLLGVVTKREAEESATELDAMLRKQRRTRQSQSRHPA